MLSVLLVSALFLGQQGDAPKRPVFSAQAYVVVCPNTFAFVDKFRTSNGLAMSHGLTSDNFQAFVNNEPLAVEISEDPQKPGFYILSVNPPEDLRDGKSHQIVVKVRRWPKPDDDQWRDLKLNWKAKFPKPHMGL